MTEVLQKSDFALKVSFVDIFGRGLSLKKFKFYYSTQLSTPVEVTFDGQNYSENCIPQADGVLVYIRNPRFNTGQIKVSRQYTISSSTFPDGQRHISQIEYLPIQIVEQYTNKPLPLGEPAVTVANANQENILINEVLVVEAFKGDKGDAPRFADYTSLVEQKLDGQYWFNNSGEKKQLYSKTLIGTFPQSLNGAIGIIGYLKSVEGTIDCYSEAYKEALYVNNSPAKFRDAGSLGIYYDIPSSLYSKRYKLIFTYSK